MDGLKDAERTTYSMTVGKSRLAPLGLLIAILLVASTWICSCRRPAPAPVNLSQSQIQPQATEAHVLSTDEQSCKVFVQKFYDWYWNQFADKADDPKFDEHNLHDYDDALRLKPPVLSPELARLIEKDRQESKAAGGDIVNLDFDPFLNSNGPVGKYVVQRVGVLNGECKANLEGGHGVHEVAELRRTGSAWMFVNFRYSFYSEDGKARMSPDNDLIHILNR